MFNDQLAKIEKKLKILYEQLDSLEDDVLTNQNPRARTQCKQQIREDIKPEIKRYEADYMRVLHQESESLTFSETDAKAAIKATVNEMSRIISHPNAYPDELIQQVREITKRLDQPATSAALKIKPILSLLPPGIGLKIEGELDIEKFFRRNFPTFIQLARGAKK